MERSEKCFHKFEEICQECHGYDKKCSKYFPYKKWKTMISDEPLYIRDIKPLLKRKI